MRSFINRAVVVALMLAGGTLLAQPNNPSPQVTPDDPSEMRVGVQNADKEIQKDTRTVITLQLQARKDKDVVRLTCINDKLLQIKALRNIFDQQRTSFEAAEKQSEYGAIVSTASGVRQLREQAQICAGEAQFVSDTQTGYTSPDVPDDPSKDLFPNGPENPGYASPFN